MTGSHGIRTACPNNRGTSLIELTCAVFLLTLGIFGALTLHLRAMDGTRGLQQQAVALDAVRNEIETLRAADFASLSPGVEQPFRTADSLTSRLFDGRGTVAISATPVPDLVEVSAEVLWKADTGRRARVTLSTRIARKERQP
jgi:Tfp pilus assembly protein PilV